MDFFRAPSEGKEGQWIQGSSVLLDSAQFLKDHVKSARNLSTKSVKRTFHLMMSVTQSGIHKDWSITNTEFGQGHYGVVKYAQNRWDGRPAAVKILPKRDAWGCDKTKIIEEEISLMRDIEHPNCIAMYGHYQSKSHVYIVMEPVTGGQLLERIIAKDHYSETEAAHCFIQIIGAVKYLHQIGIVHRDLKPENVLYASEAPDAPLKVCDFGLSKRIDMEAVSSGRQRLWSKCGSPDYVAPEVLGTSGYCSACDVWSCGVILYVLLSGTVPFGDSSVGIKFRNIRKGRYGFPEEHWAAISPAAQDLVRHMLQVDVSLRFSCCQCLEHAWVRSYLEDGLSKAPMSLTQQALSHWRISRHLATAIDTCSALSRMSRYCQSPALAGAPSDALIELILSEVRADPDWEAQLKHIFSILDRQGIGRVGEVDLRRAAEAVGTPQWLSPPDEMVAHFDVYKKGYFELDEFCVMMSLPRCDVLKEAAGDGFASTLARRARSVQASSSDMLSSSSDMPGSEEEEHPLERASEAEHVRRDSWRASRNDIEFHLNDPKVLLDMSDLGGSAERSFTPPQGWEVLEEVLQAERRERRESMANEADGTDAAAAAAAAVRDCDWLNAPAASISTLGVLSHQPGLGALQPPGGMRSNLLVCSLYEGFGEGELRDMFDALDVHAQGQITCDALKEVICALGMSLSDSDAQQMVSLVDQTGKGCIDLEDFRMLFKELLSPTNNTGAASGSTHTPPSTANRSTFMSPLLAPRPPACSFGGRPPGFYEAFGDEQPVDLRLDDDMKPTVATHAATVGAHAARQPTEALARHATTAAEGAEGHSMPRAPSSALHLTAAPDLTPPQDFWSMASPEGVDVANLNAKRDRARENKTKGSKEEEDEWTSAPATATQARRIHAGAGVDQDDENDEREASEKDGETTDATTDVVLGAMSESTMTRNDSDELLHERRRASEWDRDALEATWAGSNKWMTLGSLFNWKAEGEGGEAGQASQDDLLLSSQVEGAGGASEQSLGSLGDLTAGSVESLRAPGSVGSLASLGDLTPGSLESPGIADRILNAFADTSGQAGVDDGRDDWRGGEGGGGGGEGVGEKEVAEGRSREDTPFLLDARERSLRWAPVACT